MNESSNRTVCGDVRMFVVSRMTFEPAGSDGRPLVLIEMIYRWENAIKSTGPLGPCAMRKRSSITASTTRITPGIAPQTT
jgi:hypothetical protein